jgi:hypothetical protein
VVERTDLVVPLGLYYPPIAVSFSVLYL